MKTLNGIVGFLLKFSRLCVIGLNFFLAASWLWVPEIIGTGVVDEDAGNCGQPRFFAQSSIEN